MTSWIYCQETTKGQHIACAVRANGNKSKLKIIKQTPPQPVRTNNKRTPHSFPD